MSRRNAGYNNEILSNASSKKSGVRIAIVILLIVLALILLATLVLFGLLKSGENKGGNKENKDISKYPEDNFADYVSGKLDNAYGYYFYFEIEGDDYKKILPEWTHRLVEYSMDENFKHLDVDDESILYCYGYIYQGGSNIYLAIANPDGCVKYDDIFDEYDERRAEDILSHNTIQLVGNDTGLYITNISFLSGTIIPFLSPGGYAELCCGKYVKIADNGTGQDINKELMTLLSSMKKSDVVKLGVTENGEKAFSCSEDFTCVLDDELGADITFPKDFSMYVYENRESGNVFINFEGSSSNLRIKGYISECYDYRKPFKLAEDALVLDYKEFYDKALTVHE